MNRRDGRRQRLALVTLPAIVVLGVYVFAVYRPSQARLVQARKRTASARGSHPANSVLEDRRSTLHELELKSDAMANQLSSRQTGEGSRHTGALFEHEETFGLAAVTRVFQREDVLILNESKANASDASRLMPADVARTFRSFGEGAESVRHGVWQFELVGSFSNMRASLAALGKLDVPNLPLTLSMQASVGGGFNHKWSMWIWL